MVETPDYCRQIEGYLCQKNDGHLIRVVGPAFDLVSGWAARGVPLKVAFNGIDRCFERYYRKGARRRPVHVSFCDNDVLDAFDEWRRAVGLPVETTAVVTASPREPDSERTPATQSLSAHLERVVARLSSGRANGRIGAEFDALIDMIAADLDNARAAPRGLRGDARQVLLARLMELDAALLDTARRALDDTGRDELMREAEADLAGFRDRMTPDAFERARRTAFDRLVRDRFGLPIVAFE
jgi:hypothetical protein